MPEASDYLKQKYYELMGMVVVMAVVAVLSLFFTFLEEKDKRFRNFKKYAELIMQGSAKRQSDTIWVLEQKAKKLNPADRIQALIVLSKSEKIWRSVHWGIAFKIFFHPVSILYCVLGGILITFTPLNSRIRNQRRMILTYPTMACFWGLVVGVLMSLPACANIDAYIPYLVASTTLPSGVFLFFATASIFHGLSHWIDEKDNAKNAICPHCIARFSFGPGLPWLVRYSNRLIAVEKTRIHNDFRNYFICRRCGRSDRFEKVDTIVAVVDRPWEPHTQRDGKTLYVNIMISGYKDIRSFDPDRIVIRHVPDFNYDYVLQLLYLTLTDGTRGGLAARVESIPVILENDPPLSRNISRLMNEWFRDIRTGELGIADQYLIHRMVFTNVESGGACVRSGEFRLLCYSGDLITEGGIQEIAKRTHFRTAGKSSEKETVFFLHIKGKIRLVVLHITTFPSGKPSIGRDIPSICHGFVFPPELWEKFPEYSDLMALARDHMAVEHCHDLALSPESREPVSMSPIGIPKAIVTGSEELPPLNRSMELPIAILLNRLAGSSPRKPMVFIKGEASAIESLMNKTMAWVPDVLRPNIGFDPFFDKGADHGFALPIVGCLKKIPFNAPHILINLKWRHFSSGGYHSFLKPETAYDAWLIGIQGKRPSPAEATAAFFLSRCLQDDSVQLPKNISYPKGFVQINHSLIRKVFLEHLKRRIGNLLASSVDRALEGRQRLELICRRLEPAALGKPLEKVVLDSSHHPKPSDIDLLSWIAETDRPALKMIYTIWRGHSPDMAGFDQLPQSERQRLLAYWMTTEKITRPWLLAAARREPEINRKLAARLVVKPGIGVKKMRVYGFDAGEIARGCLDTKTFIDGALSAVLEKREYDLAAELLGLPITLRRERKAVERILDRDRNIPPDLAGALRLKLEAGADRGWFKQVKRMRPFLGKP